MLLVKGIFLTIFLVQSSHCWNDGAGTEACVNMLPLHGAPPQLTPAPYTITPSTTSVSQGQTVTVTINRTNTGTNLRGFIIQARNAANIPVGQFFLTTGMRTMGCGDFGVGSVATHSNPTARDYMILAWVAPTNFLGGVVFQ